MASSALAGGSARLRRTSLRRTWRDSLNARAEVATVAFTSAADALTAAPKVMKAGEAVVEASNPADALSAAPQITEAAPLLSSMASALLFVFSCYGFVPTCRALHAGARSLGWSRSDWPGSNIRSVALHCRVPLIALSLALASTTAIEAVCSKFTFFRLTSLDRIKALTRPVARLATIFVTARMLLIVQARALESASKRGAIAARKELSLRYDGFQRLLAFATVSLALLAALRAVGVEVATLLSVGGISGLAIGLAGRQILENVFSAFALFLTAPFSPGEDILFSKSSSLAGVEGTVISIGLLRTELRNYDMHLFSVSNVEAANCAVLNISRRPSEYLVFDRVPVLTVDIERLDDAVVAFRRLLKADERVPNSLVQRAYVDQISEDGTMSVMLRFYVTASNRTLYWHQRHDFLLLFASVCTEHGVRLARPVWSTADSVQSNGDDGKSEDSSEDEQLRTTFGSDQ